VDKRKPTYDLDSIKAAVLSGRYRITATARASAHSLGMSDADIVRTVANLTRGDFFKSMTTYRNSRTWQDVYRPRCNGIVLYIKFQIDEDGYLDCLIQGEVMMSKMCAVCGKGEVSREVRRMTYEYKGVSVEVDQPGEWCAACGEGFLSPEDMSATRRELHDAIAKGKCMLSSDDIRRIRRKLGLTQKQAATLFGGGPNAFSRYERGETIQPKALDALLRLLDRHPGLLHEVGLDKAA